MLQNNSPATSIIRGWGAAKVSQGGQYFQVLNSSAASCQGGKLWSSPFAKGELEGVKPCFETSQITCVYTVA